MNSPLMQPEQDPTTRLLNLLRFKARGMTITEISRATKMNRNSVAKYLQMLLVSGQVAVEKVGNAKIYSLSRRIPLSAILSYSSDLIAVIDRESPVTASTDWYIPFATPAGPQSAPINRSPSGWIVLGTCRSA